MKPKVVFSNVTKQYSLYKKKSDKLLGLFVNKGEDHTFHALKNISFEVYEGETIGVIGTNGSGKSTLSNLLARIVPPTEGTIQIEGETSLIAIAVGLNNNITGLENIELKCLMHGLDKEMIKELTPKIIDFADIGNFINQPVKNYSSGMKSRLGFAISVHTEPDILVIDEALSVGDQTFYEKCLKKINEFKSQGKTIFFISHSISQIKKISDRVMWLSFGEIKEFGDPDNVINQYNDYVKWFNNLTDSEKKEFKRNGLLNQSKVTNEDSAIIPRTIKFEKKRDQGKSKNVFVYIQLIVLFLLLVISATLMFVKDTSGLHSIFHRDSKEVITHKIETKEVTSVDINRWGMVNINTLEAYFDDEQKEIGMSLPFATNIFIKEEVGPLYKINYLEHDFYVLKSNVDLLDPQTLKPIEISLLEFVPMFPDNLHDSYQYFYAQLNQSYDEIKSKLRGLTEDTTDINGNKVLHFSIDNVTFVFNEEEIAETLIIQNINVEPMKEILLKSAQLISKDKTNYYINTNDNVYIINISNNTLIIEQV